MNPLFNFLVAVAAALPFSQALPNVTAIPAAGGCSAYPGYQASTGIAGPFIIRVSGTDSRVEGFGDTCQLIRRAGDTGIHMGRITIVDNNQLAKIAIQCNDATGLEAWSPTGPGQYSWNALKLSIYPYDAEILWGADGPAIEAYHHDAAGEGGLFLGSGNVTKWGITWSDASGSTDGLPYWTLRLLGPQSALPWNGSALYPNEIETFIKVDGS